MAIWVRLTILARSNRFSKSEQIDGYFQPADDSRIKPNAVP